MIYGKGKMPKVIFKIPSCKRLAVKVYNSLRYRKEKYRSFIYLNISKKLFKKILKKEFEEVENELISFLRRKINLKKLNKCKKELEKYWRPLNNLFFRNLKKITGLDSGYNEYIVYITEMVRDSYTPSNEIFTNPRDNIKVSGFITAEELLHLHYWDIFKRVIKNVEIPWKINKEVWEISETIPEFILTDDCFKKFGWGKNLNRNYSFIKEIKKKLDPLWKNKKSFKDFLIRVHKDII